MDFPGANILSVAQFSLADVVTVCDVAQRMEIFARRQRVTRVLQGAVLVNLFFEASTRTRISFGAAFNRLGGAVRDTVGTEYTSISKGESLSDTSRVVSGYGDVIVLRHPEEAAVSEFAAHATVPVINAGNGPGEHPTQALLDYYTLTRELNARSNQIDGLTFGVIGDLRFGRTVHSLVKLLALHSRIHFVFISPTSLGIPEEINDYLEARGHTVTCEARPGHFLRDLDALYVTRLQRERFVDLAINFEEHRDFIVNRQLLETFGMSNVVIMHPLPRDSGRNAIDLSHDLDGDPRLAIFRQTIAGIPVRMALFALVLDVVKDIESQSEPVRWFVKAGQHW